MKRWAEGFLLKRQMKNDVFVIIPAHNEKRHISKIIRRAKRQSSNIIVVDDGSDDNTSELAEKAEAVVLRHIVNMGKGAALKTGCDYSIKKGARRLVVLDADGQHKPEDIPRFLEALEKADIVFGSRVRRGKMPFVFKFGNSFINKVNDILFGIRLKDTQSGFRAFTADAYKKIRWDSQSYSVEAEMIANVGRKNLKYSEIFIKTIYSDRYKGTTVLDGVKIVLNMVWWRLTRWH
jgi:glycosyltransferase involved in cell wall biosynthesis